MIFLLEKLTVVRVVQFTSFYGTRRYIAVVERDSYQTQS
jgi:hypothetical protein